MYTIPEGATQESEDYMAAQNKHADSSGHHTREPAEAAFVETEAVSRRAYELFQQRGREPGHELDDWLRAEHELKESKSPHGPE
jgi:hypothetical protein